MRAPKLIVVLVIAALVAVGCSDDGDDPDPGEGASLSVHTTPATEDLVRSLVDAYEASEEDSSVEVVIGEQAATIGAITSGLADVTVLPEEWLADLGDDVDAQRLGHTVQVIGVAEGNPEGVTGLDAFDPDSGLRTKVCSEETSLGNLSVLALGGAGITPDPATVEAGCEDEALEQVASGDLDAVLLFTGGTTVADGAELLDIEGATIFDFQIMYVADGDSAAITSFTEFLGSSEAEEIVADLGFAH